MAIEWAALGIRVNVLTPGPMRTGMMARGDAEVAGLAARAGATTLQKRVAAPEELVGAAVYLASDASSYVTGENHRVDGGYRMT